VTLVMVGRFLIFLTFGADCFSGVNFHIFFSNLKNMIFDT
jgi:hypothetical protein